MEDRLKRYNLYATRVIWESITEFGGGNIQRHSGEKFPESMKEESSWLKNHNDFEQDY